MLTPLPIKWIKMEKFCELTGYTRKAIERKRQEGIWIEGKHWKKAPDRHIMINLEEFNQWIDDVA